jgi:hypothetical protein
MERPQEDAERKEKCSVKVDLRLDLVDAPRQLT